MADSKAKQVRNFVQALGRDDRYIVMLYYADGLTPMEISRVLDLPSGRVRTRLAELRSQLSSLTRTVTVSNSRYSGRQTSKPGRLPVTAS